MSNMVSEAPQAIGEVVDLETSSTTVFTGKLILRGFHVINTTTGDTLIKDGATQKGTVPANSGAGSWIEMGGAFFTTSLVVDPDDAGDGDLLAVYCPVDVA